MSAGLRVSAVLPCFEEAPHLEHVLDGLEGALERNAPEWEVVLVASAAARDGTPGLAGELAARRPAVRVVVQPADDPGYGRAVALGIAAARLPWVLLTDADGQFDHGELDRLVARAGRARAVVGRRLPRRDPWPRRVAGRLYSLAVTRLIGLDGIADPDCAFKLVRRDAIGTAPLTSRTGVVNAEILARAAGQGGRIVEVPVTHRPRLGGRSRFETGLGPLDHLPRLSEIVDISMDLAALAARRFIRGARG